MVEYPLIAVFLTLALCVVAYGANSMPCKCGKLAGAGPEEPSANRPRTPIDTRPCRTLEEARADLRR